MSIVWTPFVGSRLDEDERDDVGITDAHGREQRTVVISESGLYALIFKSRKAIAVQFRKWVTGEVLPALRRTGTYTIPEADNDEAAFAAPHLGTRDDRESIRVAVLMVREMKDLYGQAAGRQMWERLGFPIPEIDLAPPARAPGEAAIQPEGDIYHWAAAVRIKPSRSGATHLNDLYASYTQWCSRAGPKPMGPDRFNRMMIALFGTEEHPEMIRVIFARP